MLPCRSKTTRALRSHRCIVQANWNYYGIVERRYVQFTTQPRPYPSYPNIQLRVKSIAQLLVGGSSSHLASLKACIWIWSGMIGMYLSRGILLLKVPMWQINTAVCAKVCGRLGLWPKHLQEKSGIVHNPKP